MPGSALKRHSQCFAETQEVVGFVTDAHEASPDSTHASIEPDRIAAPFLDLEIDVDLRLRRVRLHFCIFRLDLFKIAELIQALQAHVPQCGVEHLPLFHHDLAADDLVASRRVSAERDAIHVKLTIFVHADVQIDQLLGFIKILDRHSGEIDIPSCPIQFL